MIRRLFTILGALWVASCSRRDGATTPAAASQPTIVVDVAHSQFGRPEGEEGPSYTLPPTERLLVDARTYDFSESLFPDTPPNAVQLLVGEGRQYSAPWQPSRQIELSPASLIPINDSPPFAGLKPGDRVILAIGQQRTDPQKNELVLRVLWAGLIEVQ